MERIRRKGKEKRQYVSALISNKCSRINKRLYLKLHNLIINNIKCNNFSDLYQELYYFTKDNATQYEDRDRYYYGKFSAIKDEFLKELKSKMKGHLFAIEEENEYLHFFMRAYLLTFGILNMDKKSRYEFFINEFSEEVFDHIYPEMELPYDSIMYLPIVYSYQLKPAGPNEKIIKKYDDLFKILERKIKNLKLLTRKEFKEHYC